MTHSRKLAAVLVAVTMLVAIDSGIGAQSRAAITEQAVRAHMEFLASDALNGRGSGTRDEWIAATYIASQFRLWGLEPMGDDGGYVQRIEMIGAEATAAPTLTAGALTLTHGSEMLVMTFGGATASGPLVKLAAGAQSPAGAVVLLPEGMNPGQVAGAALVLAPETPQVRNQWATRASRLPTQPARVAKLAAAPRPTVAYLDAKSYATVAALDEGTSVSFSAPVKPTSAYTWNAVGRLTGRSRPDEVLVLSAHLDHVGAREGAPGADTIFNGADDDASGTVAVMTIAEALSRGRRPERSIVFAAFGSEERGGMGAGYFVDLPVVPLNQIVADLQFEMLGRPDAKVPPKTLWLTGYERSNLGAELARHGARIVADPHPDQSFFTRSDNIRFARRGVVAHTVSSFGLHKEYHQPSDELRFIDFAHMTEAINSLVEPIRRIANGDFKPTWAPNGCPAPCK